MNMSWDHRMERSRRRAAALTILAVVLLLNILGYLVYVQRQFYRESTENLLETYEQVNKTFTMFAQRNWNVLSEWGSSLQEDADETAILASLRHFNREKTTWRYSELYLFNESGQYLKATGESGEGQGLWGAFAATYATGQSSVSSYVISTGERRVVFTVPIRPVEVSGVTYTCIAVSYDNATLEEMIGGHAYNGQSDCYIIYPDGGVMLSEEPKSEIESWMTNLFDFLEENAKVDADSFAAMRENVRSGGSGSTGYRYGGKSYYLVYQPVGFQELTIVGIVERDVVDAGMRKIQMVTILLQFFLMGSTLLAMVRSIKLDAALEMEEKENALRTEALERRKLEGLANTDGLTGLLNERCFNSTLKQKEEARQPFALFYLDLDKFKPVNDTYGHDVGDQLLKAVADRLRGCVRSSDFAFRIGGDEFALIVNGEVDADWCAQRIETIKSVIRQPYVLDGRTICIGTSCGSACYPADRADVRDIRILADHRMYEDKQKQGSSRRQSFALE